MRNFIPKIETTMEEDLIAIGLGELVEGYDASEPAPEEAAPKVSKNKIQEALDRFNSKLNR